MTERHAEYLRRNLMHAKSLGALASITVAQDRLMRMKRPPKWLLAALESARVRTTSLPHEIAQWRDSAPDAPARRQPGGSDD